MQQSTRQQSTHTPFSLRSLMSAALLAASLASVPVWAEPAKSADASKPAAMQPASQAAATAQLNINTADAQTLADRLNGVGQKKAEAIVAYRDQHGAFKSVDDLVNVTGIGAATLEKNRNLISVN